MDDGEAVRQIPRILGALRGKQDVLSNEQVDRYLTLLSVTDLQVVQSAAFDEGARHAFGAVGSDRLDGPRLSTAVEWALGSMAPLQRAMHVELADEAAISQLIGAFGRATGNTGGICLEDFPSFVRFSLAYRFHCYFETSRLSGGQRSQPLKAVTAQGRPVVVFVLGGPGAGKGTQCTRISSTFAYEHLSVGELLRKEQSRPASTFGPLIEDCLCEGKLGPADITVRLIQQAMKLRGWEQARYLVDGFPQSMEDLQVWDEVLGGKVDVTFAMFLDCSEACREARLLERGAASSKSHDSIKLIKKSFPTFRRESTRVLEQLKSQGKLRKIDSEQTVEEVWRCVQAAFGPCVVFVLGGPGSGKGTQCARISEAFGYRHLRPGDLLRDEQKRPGSQYGALIESNVRAGKVVPAEVLVQLLIQAMMEAGWEGGRFLVDGFPRSSENFEAWTNITQGQVAVKGCLYLECSMGTLEARLLERGKISGRSDEGLETIHKRLIAFHKDTLPVVERFKSQGLLRRIDGEGDLEDVWKGIQPIFGPSVIFVLAGPGVDTATLCTRIEDMLGFRRLSPGDLLREECGRPGSEYGDVVEAHFQAGKPVPSDIVVHLLKRAMELRGWEGGRYLVDSFPRSLESLESWRSLTQGAVRVEFCILLEASESTMEAGLLERGKTSGRIDGDPEAISKRVATFREETTPVLQAFSFEGILQVVNVERPVEEVWADVRRLFAPTAVFLLGGPGAGKGVQCTKVMRSLGLQHLSVRELLREEQRRPGSAGSGMAIHSHEGAEHILGLLRKAMEERGWVGGRYLIDGFPRSMEDLQRWDRALGNKVNVKVAVFLDCSEATLEARLVELGKTSRRADNSPAAIRRQLQIHRSESVPVLEHFKQQGLLRRINAEQGIEEVSECLHEVLRNELSLHIMNRAVILIKPRALNTQTARFVQSYLTTHNIVVLQKGTVTAQEVSERKLFDRQYFQILDNARADPKVLEIPVAAQQCFMGAYSVAWADAVARGEVVSASDGMQRLGLTPQQLFEASSCAGSLRLTPSISVTRLLASTGAPSFVVNAFALHWQDSFFEGADALMWLMVEFDPRELSWERFRSDMLGETDPAAAGRESIRGQMLENWQALGLREQPSTLHNCVHASAGPLEALRERMTWTGIEVADDPLGRLLLNSGIPRALLESWLRNSSVPSWRAGPKVLGGPVFDCSRACNTSVLRDSALAWLREQAALQPELWPLRTVAAGASPRLSLSRLGSAGSAPRQPPRVMTILHFNDVYNVEPRAKEPVGGIARFVTKVRQLKAEAVARGEEEAVVLFSGDAFNPSITSTTTKGRHMVPALNEIGIHTACFGNHDFDFGVDHLVELTLQTNFPWLISNVLDKRTGRPLADGMTTRLLDFHGRKIGLIGLVEKEWLVTLATLEPEDIEYEDFSPCARRLATQLKERQGAEAVIALTHMRMPNDQLLAHEAPEVDLILGGHDHHYEVHPEGPHGTYVLNSGTDFRDLTELRLEFTEGPGQRPLRVLAARHVEVDSAVEEEPQMRALVEKCQSEVSAMMEEVLGETAVDLDCRFASIRTRETNVGNFVADVIRRALKTDLAVLNSGTLRADAIIEKGPFKMRDLVNLLPMPDELCILLLPGGKVMEVLENSVSQYPRLEGRFAQVSGVSFTFDAAKPSGARVLRDSVRIGGETLELKRSYKICTKDYLRQGKDGYDVFRDAVCLADGEQTGILRTVVQDAFQEISTLNGLTSSAPFHSTQLAGKALGEIALTRVGDGPDLLKRYAISPKVEGRVVCLNPATS